MQEADKQNVQNILQRLKTLLNINTDIELAYRLHLNSSNILTNWRRRNTMDYNLIIAIAATNKIDLNYLLTGNHQTSNPLYFGEGRAEAFHVHDPQAPYHIQIITVNQNNQDAITIVPHKVAAGYLNGYADPEFIESLPTISAPGYSGGVHRGFEIRGNSMPPLHPGSYSIGRYVPRLADIRDRRVYIVVSKNDGVVIKRLINIAHEQKLVLISDNANKREYPNITIDHGEVIELWEWRGALINAIPDPSDLYSRLNDFEARITQLENRTLKARS